MNDKEQTPDTSKKSDVAGAIGVIIVILLFVFAIGTIGLYPWATEGIVQRVTHGYNGQKTISFDDGRQLRLTGQPPRSLLPGKYYKITYNNFGMFYDVEEIEK